MGSHVFCQVAALSEGFIALRTFEGTLACMGSHMYCLLLLLYLAGLFVGAIVPVPLYSYDRSEQLFR